MGWCFYFQKLFAIFRNGLPRCGHLFCLSVRCVNILLLEVFGKTRTNKALSVTTKPELVWVSDLWAHFSLRPLVSGICISSSKLWGKVSGFSSSPVFAALCPHHKPPALTHLPRCGEQGWEQHWQKAKGLSKVLNCPWKAFTPQWEKFNTVLFIYIALTSFPDLPLPSWVSLSGRNWEK